MKIGIDARALIGPRTGIGRFLEEFVRTLEGRYNQHHFILYAPRPLSFTPADPTVTVRVEPGIRGIKGAIWLQTYLPSLARRDGLDVFWGPMFHLPVLLSSEVSAVVTVHDLVYRFFPRTMRPSNYWLMKALFRLSLWRAQHVTVDSHAVSRDLRHMVPIPARKPVTVVYPGVSQAFRPHDPDEARRAVADTFGLSGSYLLTVATLEPRKNLHTLIKAVASLPESVRKRRPLVVVGGAGWNNSSLWEAAAPLVSEGSVRFLGYVADERLAWLYAAAVLFVFPSVYEGFGLPVAEAMACGLPAVVSDIPVMHEVAERAALFAPPGNPDAWAEVILQAVEDERQRGIMREAGLARAREFRPAKSAQLMMSVLERPGHEVAHAPS